MPMAGKGPTYLVGLFGSHDAHKVPDLLPKGRHAVDGPLVQSGVAIDAQCILLVHLLDELPHWRAARSIVSPEFIGGIATVDIFAHGETAWDVARRGCVQEFCCDENRRSTTDMESEPWNVYRWEAESEGNGDS